MFPTYYQTYMNNLLLIRKFVVHPKEVPAQILNVFLYICNYIEKIEL